MTTTVNIRIEKSVKTQANKTLKALGLDMSSAVKLFLTQVVREDGLPFKPTRNPATIRERWDAQVAAANRTTKYFRSSNEALKGL